MGDFLFDRHHRKHAIPQPRHHALFNEFHTTQFNHRGFCHSISRQIRMNAPAT